MIFEGKKSTGDYHGSFNFEVFHEWFQQQLLPNLPDKSCIIMDRATYHICCQIAFLLADREFIFELGLLKQH